MKNIKLLVVEFLILFVLMSICILTKNNDDDINILEKNISDWQSKYIAYDEGWHINDESIKTSREVDAIYGPYAFLKRGYYTLKISYDCEFDQAFKIFANNGNDEYIKSDKGILDAKKRYVSYKFNLTNDIDNFEVQIKYNGVGNLNVYNISVHKDNTFYSLLHYPISLNQIKRNQNFDILRKISFLISL